MDKMLAGKTAIITGAARGIGAATATLFAREGARLVLTDLDQQPLAETASALSAAGAEVITLAGDVTDPDFPRTTLELAEKAFGTPDILVNNAGFTWDAIFHKMEQKQWDAILAVHLTAVFRMMQTIGGAMREKAKLETEENTPPPARKIVNISSISGTDGNPGQANYSAAKAGVIGLTKTVAKEWGRFNIYVNAVAFGWIDTRLTRDRAQNESVQLGDEKISLGIPQEMLQMAKYVIALGRAGNVDEAAGAILFLASPLSNYVSAQTLLVDGGR
ncbi:MAG: SDR family oxidoreductase [Planctomycetaceae bacterium]|nr:SDR family oxidoreductase [Planctomycetaceae bacterium]